jgi:hypothetical protein
LGTTQARAVMPLGADQAAAENRQASPSQKNLSTIN